MSELSRESQSTVKNEGREQNAFHLIGQPKIILTRIDEGGVIPATVASVSPLKKHLKRLNVKKKLLSKEISNSPGNDGTGKRPRGRPKKHDDFELTPSIKKQNKSSNILKRNRVKIDCGPVKSLLNKTMLQKRSKVIIPPANKTRVMPNRHKRKGAPFKPKSKVLPMKSKLTVSSNKDKKIVKVQESKRTSTKINVDPPPTKTKVDLPPTKIKVDPPPSKMPPTKIKVDPPPPKPEATDLSDDEFLYDELIEELEKPPAKKVKLVQNNAEKTTNITLKPNVGNKPPTIVKGGIIKKSDLPADLKPMAALNGFSDSRSRIQNTNIKGTPGPNVKQATHVTNGSASKKSSPWPISISPSKSNTVKKQPTVKSSVKSKPSKIEGKVKVVPPPPSTKFLSKPTSPANPVSIEKVKPKIGPTKSLSKPTSPVNPVSIEKVKPKIGPKQTAKVVPLSKSVAEDDSLSDEYTEEERLDDPDSVFPIITKSVNDVSKSTEMNHMPTITASKTSFKDDEDPNIDLLRILTDDMDESPALKLPEDTPSLKVPEDTPALKLPDDISALKLPEAGSKKMEDLTNKDVIENKQTTKANDSPNKSLDNTINMEIKPSENEVEAELEPSKDPQPRTIYELMNEIALQYPSWNLHIIPENSSFCIAQVTKGRLGLPTLKKCIELNPDSYNAKVYIHQYHIKRFDGVYDSEESILALFNEINNIKA